MLRHTWVKVLVRPSWTILVQACLEGHTQGQVWSDPRSHTLWRDQGHLAVGSLVKRYERTRLEEVNDPESDLGDLTRENIPFSEGRVGHTYTHMRTAESIAGLAKR